MVPYIDNGATDECLDFREVEHHAVSRIAILARDVAGNRDFDGIAVPMQVSAQAAMIRNAVARIEFESSGDKHEVRAAGLFGRLL
ncbi:hypothetical protein GCM10025770_00720 [Viridibacterium curvum]|uniref:Uncharacterized protein n=1 Tax=Viridibacterium curvum TaxID=1101404 RepID=A0ABP9Q651_9RHOO